LWLSVTFYLYFCLLIAIFVDMNRFAKFLLILLGTISLALGVLGIFVPGLPTTPFLLLTAALYMRSSQKLYNKLIGNKYVGPYVVDFYQKKGMTLKEKVRALSLMWGMIFISTFFFIENKNIDLIVIGVGLIGTLVMGFVVKLSKK